MISALKAAPGEPNRDLVTEYFRKLENPAQLMPNEELEDLPLRFVPATVRQMAALSEKLTEFGNGERAAAAFPPHPEPESSKPSATPPPKVTDNPPKSPQQDPLWWRGVIISLPRKGMKRDDYLKHPDTIGALYDLRHGEDEEGQAARQRLWGMVQWKPEPREYNGKTYQPSAADFKSYEALQAFKAWFEANHPGEKL